MPTRRRGYCGTCEEVTDWAHAVRRSNFNSVVAVKCDQCETIISQV